jgi:hypothetical protein
LATHVVNSRLFFTCLVGCLSETPIATETVSVDEHSGWWCNEHGVPEEECALCDTTLVSTFKAKNDWCDEHNRPESQCFTCNPDNFAKFASRYEAKFGEQPPQPTE